MSDLNHVELPAEGVLTRTWRKIWAPRTKRNVAGYILGNRPVVIATHYHAAMKRTLPCKKNKGGCDQCDQGKGARPMGYLAGAWKVGLQPFVYELTEACLRALVSHELAKTGLRGKYLETFRKGDGKRAPVWFDLREGLPSVSLPDDFDVEPSLWRLWEGGNSTHDEIDSLKTLIEESLPDDLWTPQGGMDV